MLLSLKSYFYNRKFHLNWANFRLYKILSSHYFANEFGIYWSCDTLINTISISQRVKCNFLINILEQDIQTSSSFLPLFYKFVIFFTILVIKTSCFLYVISDRPCTCRNLFVNLVSISSTLKTKITAFYQRIYTYTCDTLAHPIIKQYFTRPLCLHNGQESPQRPEILVF